MELLLGVPFPKWLFSSFMYEFHAIGKMSSNFSKDSIEMFDRNQTARILWMFKAMLSTPDTLCVTFYFRALCASNKTERLVFLLHLFLGFVFPLRAHYVLPLLVMCCLCWLRSKIQRTLELKQTKLRLLQYFLCIFWLYASNSLSSEEKCVYYWNTSCSTIFWQDEGKTEENFSRRKEMKKWRKSSSHYLNLEIV